MVEVDDIQQSKSSRATGGVIARRLSSGAWARRRCAMRHAQPMSPTNGLTTKAPPSIAASVTLHLQGIRSAVARGWGGGGGLIGAARV